VTNLREVSSLVTENVETEVKNGLSGGGGGGGSMGWVSVVGGREGDIKGGGEWVKEGDYQVKGGGMVKGGEESRGMGGGGYKRRERVKRLEGRRRGRGMDEG